MVCLVWRAALAGSVALDFQVRAGAVRDGMSGNVSTGRQRAPVRLADLGTLGFTRDNHSSLRVFPGDSPRVNPGFRSG
jgi:hypothetical protein